MNACVEDNGFGCPKEEIQKLLLSPVNSRRTGEQGMGHALYAAAIFVRSLEGDMKVKSEEGEWFRVKISLPVFDSRIHQAKSFADAQKG